MITYRNFRIKKKTGYIYIRNKLIGGKKMKKLGFGCMRLPNLGTDDRIDMPQFTRMVDTFLSHGFTYFDTSLCLSRRK